MISINLRPMDSVFGLLRIFHLLEVNKSETSRSTGPGVSYKLHFIQTAIFFKNTFKISIVCLEVEAKYTNDPTRAWV